MTDPTGNGLPVRMCAPISGVPAVDVADVDTSCQVPVPVPLTPANAPPDAVRSVSCHGTPAAALTRIIAVTTVPAAGAVMAKMYPVADCTRTWKPNDRRPCECSTVLDHR